jgi:glycosyltransferase involved in cell wall biosynthesis
MAKLQNEGLAVEITVVDNNSTDQTKSVVESFSGQLPLKYLFEARSGKNRALNTALEKVRLGKIVVFTDDDVDVPPDWLVSIQSVCDRWPDCSVFGGRINVVFPVDKVPRWALGSVHVYFCFCSSELFKYGVYLRRRTTPLWTQLVDEKGGIQRRAPV